MLGFGGWKVEGRVSGGGKSEGEKRKLINCFPQL